MDPATSRSTAGRRADAPGDEPGAARRTGSGRAPTDRSPTQGLTLLIPDPGHHRWLAGRRAAAPLVPSQGFAASPVNTGGNRSRPVDQGTPEPLLMKPGFCSFGAHDQSGSYIVPPKPFPAG